MSRRGSRVPGGAPAVQITCAIPRRDSARLRQLLEAVGVCELTAQAARRTLLRERRRQSGPTPLWEELVELVRIHVPVAREARVLSGLAEGFGFGEPGRGSVVSRRLDLVGIAASACGSAGARSRAPAAVKGNLAGLCCIVPRGEGTTIARVALEAGLCAPVVTYGRGVGLRGRLGLIRITIPAEKEIVTLFVSRHDVEEAFRLMSEVMRLDRPGGGFCYWFPLSAGVLDTRIWVGRQPHVASMEQVIAALDVVTGDTAWRRKAERAVPLERRRPLALASYTIHGTEGETESLVRAALNAGASGATLSRVRRERPRRQEAAPSAREVSDLVVAESALARVHGAAIGAGLLELDGFAEVAGVGAASGYRAP